jgi:NAD(P)-dependent dehydrogenase (short-subunit alcohol dehydrogenase family)
MTSLRADLLSGSRIACGGGDWLTEPLRALGAWTDAIEPGDEQALAGWVASRLPLHGLVHDARADFQAGGLDALQATLATAWTVARAVATVAMLDSEHGGRLVFIAPSPAAGPHAAAARAALENLARTLSIEWARFKITAVALWPGERTGEAPLAELVCYLMSPAGGYFTGCRFELGAVVRS